MDRARIDLRSLERPQSCRLNKGLSSRIVSLELNHGVLACVSSEHSALPFADSRYRISRFMACGHLKFFGLLPQVAATHALYSLSLDGIHGTCQDDALIFELYRESVTSRETDRSTCDCHLVNTSTTLQSRRLGTNHRSIVTRHRYIYRTLASCSRDDLSIHCYLSIDQHGASHLTRIAQTGHGLHYPSRQPRSETC